MSKKKSASAALKSFAFVRSSYTLRATSALARAALAVRREDIDHFVDLLGRKKRAT
jgi:hypothetical protein